MNSCNKKIMSSYHLICSLSLDYPTTPPVLFVGCLCVVDSTAGGIFWLCFSSWLESVAAVAGVVVGFSVHLAVSCLRRALLHDPVDLFACPHSRWADGVPAGSAVIYFAISPARPSCRLQTRAQVPADDPCPWCRAGQRSGAWLGLAAAPRSGKTVEWCLYLWEFGVRRRGWRRD